MPREISISKFRNIGIMAHIDAGKTTTTERMLFYSGFLHKLGEVDEGTAFMDYMEQEKERGITITSAATPCKWKGHHINIIDTPGHVDFTAEVQRSLRVLDGAIALFCGVGGVEPQSETVWHQADEYKVPRIAFINKMDRMGANFENALESMRSRLKTNPVPIEIPMGSEENFEGVIDLVKMTAVFYDMDSKGVNFELREIPPQYREIAEKYRYEMLEAIAALDDSLLEKYLETADLEEEEIKKAIRKGVLELKIVPVLTGSSLKNVGVQPLLDAVVDYLPSPEEVHYSSGFNPENYEEKIERKAIDEEPFSALAFKILTDPYVGKITFIRIYSGSVKVGQAVLNTNSQKKEKILKLYRMSSNRRDEFQEAFAGDILAVPNLKFTRTGDTLTDEKFPIMYEKINFTEPVINQAIEAKTMAEQEKLLDSLSRLAEEDPTFTFKNDAESGQLIISGVGELHLEIIVDRLKREFNLIVKVGKPQVAYRETVTDSIEKEGLFDKDIAGKKAFGEVKLRIESSGDEGNKFENLIRNNKIPKNFIAAAEEGALQALQVGPQGYQMVNVKVTLLDINLDAENVNEVAIKIASSIAVKDACREATPQILEPIFQVEITTPDEYMGEVIADLNSRKGRVESISQRATMQVITGLAPLSEMFGYVTKLRSISQGRASYSMIFRKYEAAQIKKIY